MSARASPGGVDRLLGEVHGAVGVRERAGLLAPERRGQHDVGEPRGLGQERVRDDEEQAALARGSSGSASSSGSDTAGLVPLTQRNSIEPCSA